MNTISILTCTHSLLNMLPDVYLLFFFPAKYGTQKKKVATLTSFPDHLLSPLSTLLKPESSAPYGRLE